jgi:hypothetical protein
VALHLVKHKDVISYGHAPKLDIFARHTRHLSTHVTVIRVLLHLYGSHVVFWRCQRILFLQPLLGKVFETHDLVFFEAADLLGDLLLNALHKLHELCAEGLSRHEVLLVHYGALLDEVNEVNLLILTEETNAF